MNKSYNQSKTWLQQCITGIVWLCLAYPVMALDNPDAANRLAAFETREQVHRQAVNHPDNTTLDTLRTYADYEAFLTTELAQTYQFLQTRLGATEQHALQQAQCRWETYRDAEIAMIQQTWTRAQFGSSFALSRGMYRTSLIRARIIQLILYANNYL